MHLGAAAVAGLLAGSIVALAVYLASALSRGGVRLNPFSFLGSAVFVEDRPIYWSGAVMYAVLSIAIAIAHVNFYQLRGYSLPWEVWGALYGTLQYLVIGVGAAFMPDIHPAMRTGDIPVPGLFARSQPLAGRTALFLANVGYGVLVAMLYAAFL